MARHVRALLCLCAAAAASGAHAETITLNVNSLYSTYGAPVPIQTEWDEGMFGRTPSTSYNHDIARLAILLSEICYLYNDDIASPDNTLLQAYHRLGVQDKDIELHYDTDFTDQELGKDQCKYSFAHRSIQSALGKKELVFLIIRGTSDISDEWISNLNISDDTGKESVLHEGFRKAADQVLQHFLSYLERSGIDTKDAFLLITGHSRGASIANLLGYYLADGSVFLPERIYDYTFASPNVTTDEDAQNPRYDFIWNIVNAEDIVPTVPIYRDKWKFRKFGRIRTLVNYWNCAPALYDENYLPRIDAFHRRLNGHGYTPFKTGPFIPIQITTLFSSLNGDVEKFYTGPFSLRGKGERILGMIFPSAGSEGSASQSQSNGGGAADWLDRLTGGKISYMAGMFTDMHMAESYLSFMMALDGNEVFSSVGCSQIIIQGCPDGAIIDGSGAPLLQFVNGKVLSSSIKFPVVAWNTPSNLLIIGIPGTMDVDVVLSHQSILPTSVPITIERFGSAGIIEQSFGKQHLYPHKGLAYRFPAGAVMLRDHKIFAEELRWTEASQLLAQTGISSRPPLLISPEINMTSDFNLGYGIHVGIPAIYGSIMGGKNVFRLLNSIEVSPGIGTQQTLIGPVMIDIETYLKCIAIIEKWPEIPQINLVPSGRVSLSYKPFRKANIFVAGVFDFRIAGFNEEAFSSYVRVKNFQLLPLTNSVSVLPSLQFGVRF